MFGCMHIHSKPLPCFVYKIKNINSEMCIYKQQNEEARVWFILVHTLIEKNHVESLCGTTKLNLYTFIKSI